MIKWDIIVLCSGTYIEAIIDKIYKYNQKPFFNDRFKKVIIFGKDAEFYQDSIQAHPDLVFGVTDRLKDLVSMLNSIIAELEGGQ